MTKAELEIKVKELEKELKELREFPKIVEEKDSVISELQSKHREELDKKDSVISELQSKHQEELDEEKRKLKNSNNETIKRLTENFENQRKELFNRLSQREQQLAKLIDIFGNTLKGIQGQLDNAIVLNDYFLNEVKE